MTDNWFVAGPNVAGMFLSALQLLGGAIIVIRVRNDPSLTHKPVPTDDTADEEGGDGSHAMLSSQGGSFGDAGGDGSGSDLGQWGTRGLMGTATVGVDMKKL